LSGLPHDTTVGAPEFIRGRSASALRKSAALSDAL
jgi:hypothetical protein